MKSTVTLTIVTPVYNGEKFMRQTIESVLSQAGSFYIDYIIVDDGSTDSSLEIIKDYANRLKENKWKIECLGIEFRYFTGPNQGQTKAYNKSFSAAHGQIMAWMNADDYYLPGALNEVAKLYESDPTIDFIYSKCLKLYESGNSFVERLTEPRPDETFDSLRTRGNSFDVCFFTKRIFDKVGPLDESLKYCMDLEFWFRVFAVGKIKYLPFATVAYRLWSGANTVKKQDGFERERIYIAKKYGGNVIPAKKIYKIRGKLKILNTLQQKFPSTYNKLKIYFYKTIDIFKYKSTHKQNV
ncbi:MAG: glycosyltransferase [Parcubacteria group bacterium]